MNHATAYAIEGGFNVCINGELIEGCQIDGDTITFKASIKYGPTIPQVGETLAVKDVENIEEGLPPGTVGRGDDGNVLVFLGYYWDQGGLWHVAGSEKKHVLCGLKLGELTILHVPGKEKP